MPFPPISPPPPLKKKTLGIQTPSFVLLTVIIKLYDLQWSIHVKSYTPMPHTARLDSSGPIPNEDPECNISVFPGAAKNFTSAVPLCWVINKFLKSIFSPLVTDQNKTYFHSCAAWASVVLHYSLWYSSWVLECDLMHTPQQELLPWDNSSPEINRKLKRQKCLEISNLKQITTITT